jgi:glucose-1-phosphate cytidylyltransferase
MRTLILCGGRGTRAYPETRLVPKPLLEVAGEPVLLHVMRLYADQGLTDFVLSAGYLAEQIEAFAASLPDNWRVEVVDTGEDTGTAGRILKCSDRLDGTFHVNYADGLANVDLHALAGFHAAHAGCATVTSVPLPSPYGTLEHDAAGRVTGFREKPVLADHRINGGFFVFDESVFARWVGDDLERELLPALAAAGELFTHRHEGFWRSMDTYKDAVALTELARRPGGPPWRS